MCRTVPEPSPSATESYIRDFNRILETTTTARELYREVLKRHPGRLNPGALWTSARVLKP
jgi:hypothetical protein